MAIDFVRRSPETTIMTITPQIANQMLETSSGNRKLRRWYVDMLAAAMKRGEWRVTSQGIGFDTFGRLRDAHHRLHACIKADVSFQSIVVFGMRADAYEVIDTGMKRTYADRLHEDKRIADALRLGCAYALGIVLPTIDQMRPIIDAGFGDAVRGLIEYCGTTKKFYSAAPMKVAASISIMNGGNADFILEQYRSLCCLDFEKMTRSAQALIRQVDSGKISAGNSRDALARGFRVFDEDRKEIGKIQVSESDIDAAVELVRSVLWRSMGNEKSTAIKAGYQNHISLADDHAAHPG